MLRLHQVTSPLIQWYDYVTKRFSWRTHRGPFRLGVNPTLEPSYHALSSPETINSICYRTSPSLPRSATTTRQSDSALSSSLTAVACKVAWCCCDASGGGDPGTLGPVRLKALWDAAYIEWGFEWNSPPSTLRHRYFQTQNNIVAIELNTDQRAVSVLIHRYEMRPSSRGRTAALEAGRSGSPKATDKGMTMRLEKEWGIEDSS